MIKLKIQPSQHTMEIDLYSISEVAKMLDISKNTVINRAILLEILIEEITPGFKGMYILGEHISLLKSPISFRSKRKIEDLKSQIKLKVNF